MTLAVKLMESNAWTSTFDVKTFQLSPEQKNGSNFEEESWYQPVLDMPEHDRYQLSFVQKRRRALLIGINYEGSKRLDGPVRDVRKFEKLLHQHYNYQKRDILVLTDVEAHGIDGVTTAPATKTGILKACKCLVENTSPGDFLLFFFSGRGDQRVSKIKNVEEDGMDELILPSDHATVGAIDDDTLFDVLVRNVKPGVRLTAFVDSCHSGTIFDLPYIYDSEDHNKGMVSLGDAKKRKLADRIPEVISDVARELSKGNPFDALKEVKNLIGTFTTRKKPAKHVEDVNIGEVLLFSACADSQTTRTGGVVTGAFSSALMNTLLKNKEHTIESLLYLIRKEMTSKTQVPQLSTSHIFDLSLPLIL